MCCLAPLPHQGALVVGQLLQHLQALPFLQLLPLHKPLQGALPARQLVPLQLAFPHGFQQCDLQECLCHVAGLHVVDLVRNLLQMGGIAREGRRRQGTAGKGAGAVATASTVLPSKQCSQEPTILPTFAGRCASYFRITKLSISQLIPPRPVSRKGSTASKAAASTGTTRCNISWKLLAIEHKLRVLAAIG